LGNKIASLLAGLVVRDFPQRWTSLMDDIFTPMQQGGLWYNSNDQCETVGVKICLECLKLVAEDCTDSDFNAKVCSKDTVRKQDTSNRIHHSLILSFNFYLSSFSVISLVSFFALSL
jgi:hypothetical protein